MRGTHATTGKPVVAREVGIIRYWEGRMVEFCGVLDEAALLRSAGLVPATV